MSDHRLWRGHRAPGPEPEVRRRPRYAPFWLVPAAALTAAVLLLAALVALVLSGRGEVRLTELAPGDCLVSEDLRTAGTDIRDLRRVDCGEPHDAEVYSVLDPSVPDAAAACVDALATLDLSLPELAADGLEVRPLLPAEEDGELVCLARPVDGEQVTGSVSG